MPRRKIIAGTNGMQPIHPNWRHEETDKQTKSSGVKFREVLSLQPYRVMRERVDPKSERSHQNSTIHNILHQKDTCRRKQLQHSVVRSAISHSETHRSRARRKGGQSRLSFSLFPRVSPVVGLSVTNRPMGENKENHDA